MLRLNKKLEYGVLALLHLSEQPRRSASVKGISKACGVPETLLSKVMQKMKTGGLVSAVHGNHGGYRLDRALGEINLFEMNRALVGPVHVTECLGGDNKCPAIDSCRIISPMNVLNRKLIDLFQSTSLETLVAKDVA